MPFKSALHSLNYYRPPFPKFHYALPFTPPLALALFFPVKDRIPDGLKSHVMYLFTSQCCKALYVSQTSRLLYTRISDHMGISSFIGSKIVNTSLTSILSHHAETGHPISSDYKILSSSPSTSELLLIMNTYVFVIEFND